MNEHEHDHELTGLRILLTEINAALRERCPKQDKRIERLETDVDGAFSQIRNIDQKVAKIIVLTSMLQAILIAGAVKLFVG